MGGLIKSVAAAAAAAALYLTANLGQAWWVLLILLAIDGLLNWRNESAYLRKLGAFVVSTAAAAYLQAGAGVPGFHALVIGMAAWELARVVEQATAIVGQLQLAGKLNASEATALRTAIADLQARAERAEAAAAAAKAPAPNKGGIPWSPLPGSLHDPNAAAPPQGGAAA